MEKFSWTGRAYQVDSYIILQNDNPMVNKLLIIEYRISARDRIRPPLLVRGRSYLVAYLQELFKTLIKYFFINNNK